MGPCQKTDSLKQKYPVSKCILRSWQGRVDGRDLFKVKGNKVEIEHLRYDNILETTQKFSTPLPAIEYTVIVKDIRFRIVRSVCIGTAIC